MHAPAARAVVDARVALGIQHENAVAAAERGDHAEVGLVAGGEGQGMSHAVEGGEFGFEQQVFRAGAVRHARAGSAGTLPAQGIDRRVDAARVVGETQVVVGAG
jgi:hypothetical protein